MITIPKRCALVNIESNDQVVAEAEGGVTGWYFCPGDLITDTSNKHLMHEIPDCVSYVANHQYL